MLFLVFFRSFGICINVCMNVTQFAGINIVIHKLLLSYDDAVQCTHLSLCLPNVPYRKQSTSYTIAHRLCLAWCCDKSGDISGFISGMYRTGVGNSDDSGNSGADGNRNGSN